MEEEAGQGSAAAAGLTTLYSRSNKVGTMR